MENKYYTFEEYSQLKNIQLTDFPTLIFLRQIKVKSINGQEMVVHKVEKSNNKIVSKKVSQGFIEETKAMKLLGLDKETIRRHLKPSLHLCINQRTNTKTKEYRYQLSQIQRLGRKKKLSTLRKIEKTTKWDAVFNKRYEVVQNALTDAVYAMNVLNHYPIFNSCKPFNRDEIFFLTIRFIEFISGEKSYNISRKVGIFEDKKDKYWWDEIEILGMQYTWIYPANLDVEEKYNSLNKKMKLNKSISYSRPKISEYKALVKWFLSESEYIQNVV